MAKRQEKSLEGRQNESVDRKSDLQNSGSNPGSSTFDESSSKHPPIQTPLQIPGIALFYYSPASHTMLWSGNSHKVLQFRQNAQLPHDKEALIRLVDPDDRQAFEEGFDRVIRAHTEWTTEIRLRIPGGSFFWGQLTLGPRPENGDTVQFVGSIQDITSRKITEYELADWKMRDKLVSESAGVLIYDYDVPSGELVWSGNIQQVLGLHHHELDHLDKWAARLHPDDRPDTIRLLEVSQRELIPYDVYYRLKVEGRDYCYMHDRGLFIPNDKGEAFRMLGIVSDVSERVKAMKSVEQSEKSYRELFNCVGEAIYIQNSDGTFLDVNREACAMYGYTKEEMIGKAPDFLSAPGLNDFEKLRDQITAALKGNPQKFIWWGKRKNGEIFLKEVRLTRATYYGAEAIITTAWDITEKVAAEKSLQESEKRFRRMIEDLNVGVMLQGPHGEVQIANRASRELLGITGDNQQGASLIGDDTEFITEGGEKISPADLPWSVAARTKLSVRGVVVGRRSGENPTNWLLVNAEPTLLEQENLLHVLITLTDITDRKRTEESLRESELRFRTLQEASFGGIGLHNKGAIMDCNQGLSNLTGFSYEELIGSNGLELVAPEYRDYVAGKIAARDEGTYDVEGLRKDGSRYFLEIRGKNIPFGDGLIRVTEFRDITERKLSEAKILEQNARLLSMTEDLKLKNEQLREFTQIVSHNLRAPVSNILALLNFIDNATTQDEQNEYIGLLKEAGTTTLTTLQELNEVLQIKQDKKIERQRLRFEDVFNHVKNMLNAKIAEVKAEVITDFSMAPVIEYPNIYLESIMLNLLSNALKYTYPGRTPQIRITTTTGQNDTIQLAISDNGAGINLSRYGEHMFKLRKTFHKHRESRGIGLFMIKNQIEAMGGEISVSSVENEGSTFFVTFNQNISES